MGIAQALKELTDIPTGVIIDAARQAMKDRNAT